MKRLRTRRSYNENAMRMLLSQSKDSYCLVLRAELVTRIKKPRHLHNK